MLFFYPYRIIFPTFAGLINMNKIQNNFCLKLSTCALHESKRIVNWLPFMKTVEVSIPFQHSWNWIVWVADLSDWHLYNQSRSYLQNKGDDDFLSGFWTVRSLSWTWPIQSIIFLLRKVLDSLIERHGWQFYRSFKLVISSKEQICNHLIFDLILHTCMPYIA